VKFNIQILKIYAFKEAIVNTHLETLGMEESTMHARETNLFLLIESPTKSSLLFLSFEALFFAV
jgi:methylmalonyl-CoA mutase N-terminal domain/subunit